MKLAHTNTFSVGIFSWSALEPEEGVYTFEWLDDIFESIHRNGGRIILATPSGARPAWLSQKYPEVLRVNAERVKQLHGGRHNHCFTSYVYREKRKRSTACWLKGTAASMPFDVACFQRIRRRMPL